MERRRPHKTGRSFGSSIFHGLLIYTIQEQSFLSFSILPPLIFKTVSPLPQLSSHWKSFTKLLLFSFIGESEINND
eukprot:UN15291